MASGASGGRRSAGEPRVRITYQSRRDGESREVELPFVVGVLAPTGGNGPRDAKRLRDRRFVHISAANFDDVLEQTAPRLALRVPNRLTDAGSSLAVELHFRALRDFEPQRLVRQIGPLKELVALRKRLVDYLDGGEIPSGRAPAGGEGGTAAGEGDALPPQGEGASPLVLEYTRRLAALAGDGPGAPGPEAAREVLCWVAEIDRKLSDQLNEVLHHEAFQRLEATWRGLRFLVDQVPPDSPMKVKVLEVSKAELARDVNSAADFDQSVLFKKVYEEEYGQLGGEPYGLLVGDFEFGPRPADVGLLYKIAQVAAAAHAPFVAAAAPEMFGLSAFPELATPRDLRRVFRGADYADWHALRESEDSRYVALALPRVLARLPYPPAAKSVREFCFAEAVDGPDSRKYLWMSAAWAYAAVAGAAFLRDGWFMRTRGVGGGGRVEGLPVHAFGTDGPPTPVGLPAGTEGPGVAVKTPLEVATPDRREFELADLGFLPLLPARGEPAAVFMASQSVQRPAEYQDPAATANAELSAKFGYILSVSRFAHYLKVMAREKVGAVTEAAELQQLLQQWILDYVIGNPDTVSEEVKARRPLLAADVRVTDAPGRPGWFSAVARLTPHYQMETLKTTFRLVTDLPRRG